MSLEGELVDVLEKFVGESREEGAVIIGARPMAASLLWNLDGTMAPGCIDILPLLACEVAPGGAVQRSSLLYLFSVIRLVAVVEDKAKGNLATIDALLGCPVKLFSMVRMGVWVFQYCSIGTAGPALKASALWRERVAAPGRGPDYRVP